PLPSILEVGSLVSLAVLSGRINDFTNRCPLLTSEQREPGGGLTEWQGENHSHTPGHPALTDRHSTEHYRWRQLVFVHDPLALLGQERDHYRLQDLFGWNAIAAAVFAKAQPHRSPHGNRRHLFLG